MRKASFSVANCVQFLAIVLTILSSPWTLAASDALDDAVSSYDKIVSLHRVVKLSESYLVVFSRETFQKEEVSLAEEPVLCDGGYGEVTYLFKLASGKEIELPLKSRGATCRKEMGAKEGGMRKARCHSLQVKKGMLHCQLGAGTTLWAPNGQPLAKLDIGARQRRKYLQKRYKIEKIGEKRYRLDFNISITSAENFDGERDFSVDETSLKTHVSSRYREFISMCLNRYKNLLFDKEGRQIELRINPREGEFPFAPDHRVHPVQISTKDHRSNLRNYESDIDCPAVIHELLHLAGLKDGYRETVSKAPAWSKEMPKFSSDCRAILPVRNVMHNHLYLKELLKSQRKFIEKGLLREGDPIEKKVALVDMAEIRLFKVGKCKCPKKICSGFTKSEMTEYIVQMGEKQECLPGFEHVTEYGTLKQSHPPGTRNEPDSKVGADFWHGYGLYKEMTVQEAIRTGALSERNKYWSLLDFAPLEPAQTRGLLNVGQPDPNGLYGFCTSNAYRTKKSSGGIGCLPDAEKRCEGSEWYQ